MEHQTLEDIAYTEEMARLALAEWGAYALGPGGSALVNIERMTKLFAVVRNPYHAPLAAMSSLDLMRVCAYGMIESFHYKEAFRALERIEKIERERARTGFQDPARPVPPHASGPLPPSPVVMPRPIPPDAGENWFRALESRELAVRLQAAALDRLRATPRPGPPQDQDQDPPAAGQAGPSDPNPPFS